MHLEIVEETEWDAAGEARDQSCPNMIILYFKLQVNALV